MIMMMMTWSPKGLVSIARQHGSGPDEDTTSAHEANPTPSGIPTCLRGEGFLCYMELSESKGYRQPPAFILFSSSIPQLKSQVTHKV